MHKINVHKKDTQMALKHTKRGSPLPILKKRQIKATLRCHFLPLRLAKTQQFDHIHCWWSCGEADLLLCTLVMESKAKLQGTGLWQQLTGLPIQLPFELQPHL